MKQALMTTLTLLAALAPCLSHANVSIEVTPPPTIRCGREIYRAAIAELLKLNFELEGVSIKLEQITAIENDRKAFNVALDMTDSSNFVRQDNYKVILADAVLCKVKSTTLQSD